MKHLVLAGAGHAHAQVLQQWATHPVPGVCVTVVSPEPLAPYSGMVPGWLAGTYRFDDIVIDFEALCARAGASWIPTELDRLEPDQQTLHLANGEALAYDTVSLNVGSTLRPPVLSGAGSRVIALRPLSKLRSRYEDFLYSWTAEGSDSPVTVTAVGGGAAGVESLLAVLHRLRQARPDRQVHGVLISRSTMLLPGFAPAACRAALNALTRAGVVLQLGSTWRADSQRKSELMLWATGAQAQDWQLDPLRRNHLSVSDDGFVRVDAQLRSISHPQVFAVGDCAHWEATSQTIPKAGVYAVRMGPVLSHNLRAALTGGRPMTAYAPQRRYLALLGTADGRAIASRGGLGASGAWAWHLKDHIDRRFIRRFASGAQTPDDSG
jgi:pyridine nucleotide-disulfide oxidoreductase family protein